jgi:hypothetical protein
VSVPGPPGQPGPVGQPVSTCNPWLCCITPLLLSVGVVLFCRI